MSVPRKICRNSENRTWRLICCRGCKFVDKSLNLQRGAYTPCLKEPHTRCFGIANFVKPQPIFKLLSLAYWKAHEICYEILYFFTIAYLTPEVKCQNATNLENNANKMQ